MTDRQTHDAAAPDPRLTVLAGRFPDAEFSDSFGQAVCRVPRETLVEFLTSSVAEGFGLFVDLCAVDYLHRDPRFEVVVNLVALDPPGRLRILVGVPGEDPAMPSITGVLHGANFYEREAFDLFGIDFVGHPDLTRILLPDDWVGHPLRKDAVVGSVPVQFKGANTAR